MQTDYWRLIMELRTLKIKGIKFDVYFVEEDNGVIIKEVSLLSDRTNLIRHLDDEVINEIEKKLCADLVPQDHDSIASLGLSGMFAPDTSPVIRFGVHHE